MLRNDVKRICEITGLSKTTVYRRAERAGLDLTPIKGRDASTPDMFTGKTVMQEHEEWLKHAVTKILAVEHKEKSVPNAAIVAGE